MRKALVMMLIGAAVSSAPAAHAGRAGQGDETCRIIRYAPDGRRTETSPQGDRRTGSPGSASAEARASGSGRASSSVSAHSSSDGSTAASASSHTDAEGRTVTKTQDQNGCTIVIDERAVKGA